MKSKIGIIVQCLTGGGAERAAANLSIDLSEEYDVTLIVFDATNITYPYKGSLIDLKIKPQKGFLKKIYGVIKKIYKVHKIKRRNKFNYVISFMENANLINVLSRCGEEVLISERNMISFYNTTKVKKYIIKTIAKKADKIIALSKGVKQDLIDNFGVNDKKIWVVYNSCTKENLQTRNEVTLNEYQKLDKQYRYIVNMGRLHYQKGQWHLIKAFSLIADKYPDVKLIIIGQGILEETLKKLTKNLSLENRIIFTGYLKEPHIFLQCAEIFAFSSLVEGLGNVLLEALNFNKVIVSTDCYYGPREILAPNTDIKKLTSNIELAEYGVLVPNFDKEKKYEDLVITKEEKIYAEALIRLLENTQLKHQYEEKAYKRVEEFLPAKIKEDWKKIIEKEEM